MPTIVWILLAVAAVIGLFFWTPFRRLLGRVQDEADDASRRIAEGNPLATLGRGITDNVEALDKSLEAIGHWDALVRGTSDEVNKVQGALDDLRSQMEDRFKMHEEESAKASPDPELILAIESDVERLSSELELKEEHLKTLKESLVAYEKELKEREAEIYELRDAIEDAKRVHQAGQARDRLNKIEEAARKAGKNVGIDGVGAAENLRELADAVKRNEQARNSAKEYKRKMTGTTGTTDPRILSRDRERRIKETFERLKRARDTSAGGSA